MEFNDRITKVIEYTELSPAEFAEEIGVQRSSISHIISGRNKPSLDFIMKIKNKFPDLEWDWLINGKGEMLHNKDVEKSDTEKNNEETKVKEKKSLPDLFSLLDDENFGKDPVSNSNARDSDKTVQRQTQEKISDSQRLENNGHNLKAQRKEIRRIVFFYTDGTFETYEN